jgi:hypothetical protein
MSSSTYADNTVSPSDDTDRDSVMVWLWFGSFTSLYAIINTDAFGLFTLFSGAGVDVGSACGLATTT